MTDSYLTQLQKKNLTNARRVAKYLNTHLQIVPNTLYNKRLGDKIFVLPDTLSSLEETFLFVIPEILKMKSYSQDEIFMMMAGFLAKSSQWKKKNRAYFTKPRKEDYIVCSMVNNE